ncbi:MAG: NAD(+)/NADH kinase [Clostridia bacterium]|nr:NAD(+)/NADH kinase [Clostridia bacterium]
MAFERISIITNFNIQEKAAAAKRIVEFLSGYGCRIMIDEQVSDRTANYPASICRVSRNELTRQTDLIIVLGGDGSILTTARVCSAAGVPILGINLGRLGYMSELEADELSQLSKLFTGEYTIQRRSMLDVSIKRANGIVQGRCIALNDAVVTGAVAKMIEFELWERDEIVTSYRADGLIVATPTGSTAYSLSAGGPVIDPRTDCICVTPVCPHSLTAKPMVFAGDAKLGIKNIHVRDKKLLLTVDGKMTYDLYRGDVVQIEKSMVETKLLRFCSQGFYSTLRQKMNAD